MLTSLLTLLVCSGIAAAEAPLEARTAAARPAESADGVLPAIPAPGSGFRALALLQTRAIASNVVTTNPFLDGQVVGPLGGLNGTTVLGDKGLDLDGDGKKDRDLVGARYVEQRATAFMTWAPGVFDGRVGLTTAFEVDFLWGDASYGVGGNTGGGIGGDQVNLQTRRVHGTFRPNVGARHNLAFVTGLQFVADGVYNPASCRPDDLFRAGGGLRFWGTEAAGITAYGAVDDASGTRFRYRAGAYTLVENGVAIGDDAALYALDAQWQPDYHSRFGVHGWLLRDYTEGQGGLMGTGLTSTLSELQGGPHFVVPNSAGGAAAEVETDIVWLAADGGFNHALDRGPLGATALAATNLGRLYSTTRDPVTIRGWLVDGGLRFRWAAGAGSVISGNVLVASRDGTGINAYTGVVTGNTYGVAGATWASHGMLLLFQDPTAVNRTTPVVFDISNAGRGLTAATMTAGWDVVPNRVTLQAGAGHAVDGSTETMGTELNARVLTHPWFGTNLGVAVATVQNTEFDANPWQAMLHMEVLLF
jgi:hypothetical protein